MEGIYAYVLKNIGIQTGSWFSFLGIPFPCTC